MKKIKRTLSFLLIMLALNVGVAFGQLADVPTPERQAQRMSNVMAERLDLSEEQKQKVLDLNVRLAKKEKELLENEDLGFFDRVEKMKELTRARAQKLEGILNEQQFQKFNALNNRIRNTGNN
ncbi:hypothetical protein [Fodinibius salsisoli]|uniref:LTXXQ motif family protein n=1 Tax=Fodinibius salsisoli TaxID=2820877 RepID=A0ABT3PHM5_9BACT|nr:hypothetical protein [Fodinibius salsisoli]MCW9705283.1 hypothetical protein [Fodinibius salsisoli]